MTIFSQVLPTPLPPCADLESIIVKVA